MLDSLELLGLKIHGHETTRLWGVLGRPIGGRLAARVFLRPDEPPRQVVRKTRLTAVTAAARG